MYKRMVAALLAVLCLHATALAEDALVMQMTIGPDLPPTRLTITLQGEAEGEFGPVYQYRAELTEESGMLQTFEIESEQSLDPDMFISAIDLNFDGYLDLDVSYYLAAQNIVHRFYLWDMGQRRYVPAKLDNLEVAADIQLYPDGRLIERYTHDSAATGVTGLFQWGEGGALLPLRTVDTTQPTDEGTIRLLITDYPGGEPTVTRDEAIGFSQYVDMLQSGVIEALLWEGIQQ